MKRNLVLMVLLALAFAPVKAQFSTVYFSSYCERMLNSDNTTWGAWSDWASSEGDIEKYDEFFLINFNDVEYFLDIIDEADAVVDEQGYMHRSFNCTDDDGYDCRIDVAIDPLEAKIVQCQLWYAQTAKAFSISGEE